MHVVESLKKKNKTFLQKPDWKDYIATSTEPDEKVAEQRHLDSERDADLKEFKEESKLFNNNWSKAYAMIWKSYCSKEMQVAIEEISDFEVRIDNDPLELLNEVETLMHVP